MYQVAAVKGPVCRIDVQKGRNFNSLFEAEAEIYRLQKEGAYPFARVSFSLSRPLEIVEISKTIGAAKIRSGDKARAIELGKDCNWREGRVVVGPTDSLDSLYLCLGLQWPVDASDRVERSACWVYPFDPQKPIVQFYFKLDKPFTGDYPPARLIEEINGQVNGAFNELFGFLVNA